MARMSKRISNKITKTKEQQKDDEKSLQDRVVGAAQTTGKFTSDQVDKVKEKVDDMGDDSRVK